MCGIAGIVGDFDRVGGQRRLDRALEAMRHRGPDDVGMERSQIAGAQLLFGQTRLAVIDLSTGGHQPMVSSDGRLTLVFNGEIYNYRELRSELEAHGAVFVSRSDTEVLLHAWQQWGRASLPRLRGMFSFVVADAETRTVTCVRDAFGIKPLHWFKGPKVFAFASEIPPLIDVLGRRLEVNRRQAFRYLELGYYDESDETFVEGINKLRPGSLMVYDVAEQVLHPQERWWLPDIQERSDLTFADAAQQLRDLVIQSVSMHLRSDVPLGVTLSGGIDSSVVACTMRLLAPDADIHTFSYVARGSSVDEERWVDLVNDSIGAVSHKVTATPEEMVRDLDCVIKAQGEPFASTSIYAQYRVFQAARQAGITVTLDGQGADELFAGYAGYPVQRLRSLLSERRLRSAAAFLMAWGTDPSRSRLSLARAAAGQAIPPRYRDGVRVATARRIWMQQPEELIQRECIRTDSIPRGRHLVSVLRDGVTSRGLEALLRHGDRNSMAFSVESRVPFLTVDIAEFVLSLPEEYLVSPQGVTKCLLREATRGIVPAQILNRRDKIGFETPQSQWLRALRPELDDWLEGARGVPFLDPSLLRERLSAWSVNRPGAPSDDAVWRLLNYCRWLKLLDAHVAA